MDYSERVESAAAEALEKIREAGDRAMNGLIVYRTAALFGVSQTDVALAMGRRRGKMSVRLDMNKVKALAGKRNIEAAGPEMGLGHDTIKIIIGRDGQGVRGSTAKKICSWLSDTTGKTVNLCDIEWKDDGQMELTEETPIVDGYTETEQKLLAMLSVWNGIPEDEVIRNIVKRHLKTVSKAWKLEEVVG